MRRTLLEPYWTEGSIGHGGALGPLVDVVAIRVGSRLCWSLLTVIRSEPAIVGKPSDRFNPYLHLKHGGVTLGFRGSNYWFTDRSLAGWLMRRFVSVFAT